MKLNFSLGLCIGLFASSTLAAVPFRRSLKGDDSDNPQCSQYGGGTQALQNGNRCYAKCSKGVPDFSTDTWNKGDPWCWLVGGGCNRTPDCSTDSHKDCESECYGSPAE